MICSGCTRYNTTGDDFFFQQDIIIKELCTYGVNIYLFTAEDSVFITLTTSEGEALIDSMYAASSNDFKSAIEDWQHLITLRKYFICGIDLPIQTLTYGIAQVRMPVAFTSLNTLLRIIYSSHI